jgi:3-hydroxyacyl-CoA dehydrogenase/enoyl-CoA hydratase/3-hydroxybutyryl-CoA epimerase
MSIHFDQDQTGIVTFTLDQADSRANLLGDVLQQALNAAMTRLKETDNLTGVIITSAKKDFIAGADITKMYGIHDPVEAAQMVEEFKHWARQLETLGKPVVAAINGAALGGGYELALACHHRIVLDHPRIKIGLPEVSLGLFPGGGGSQRLPRLIGIQEALGVMLQGKQLNPQQALKAGLVDALAESPEAMLEAARAWIQTHPGQVQPWDQKGFRIPGGGNAKPAVAQLWAIMPSMVRQRTQGNYPAAEAIMSCVFEGAAVDIDTGLRIESRYFGKIATSQVAKNMMNAFWFQMNAIKKGSSRPGDLPRNSVRKVGILGAGMMGAGIAYVSAKAGIQVVLKDVDLTSAEKGKGYSVKLLEKGLQRGKVTPEMKDEVLARIYPTDDDVDLVGCDLVIEAVFEDRDLKAKVIPAAEAQLADDGFFASNTSTLPITGLAEYATKSEKFIGLHFFSPVDKMQLVEIIMGEKTDQETLARAFDYVQQIKKVPIVVNDSRGFYTSRVFTTYVLEGAAMLKEGVSPQRIEAAGRASGMPVPPLALCDEVSLSLMHLILTQTRKDLQAEGQSYTSHPAEGVIEFMVETKERVGRKTSAGFYDYPEQGKKSLWPDLATHFPVAATQPDQQVLVDRLLMVQAVETAKCYGEKVVTTAADANIGSILGWGFAPFHGGTLQFIEAMGIGAFIEKAQALAAQFGSRFEPPAFLKGMAAEDQHFS